MGYSIIFQTKMLDLGDGRIIHFSRSGCNNDNEGREKDIFQAELTNIAELTKQAKKYMEISKPYKESGVFELKIGGRPCSFYDYGKHLLRALKNAETIEDFEKNNSITVKVFDGIEILDPYYEKILYKDYPNVIEDFFFRRGRFSGNHKPLKFSYLRSFSYDVTGIIDAITNKKAAEIKIQRRKK